MRRLCLIPPLLMLLAASACAADPYADGRALYKAGKYAEAAAKFERATRDNPNNAKAWWQLNFAYHKLGREADSLNAVQKAGQIDPTHAFASGAGKYEQILADRQRTAGASVRAGERANTGRVLSPRRRIPEGSSAAGSGQSNIAQQLLNGDVYAEPGIPVNVDHLRQVAQELRPTVVKFVVYNSRAGSRVLDHDANRIRNYLGSRVGNGYVIVSSRGGVAVSSRALSPDTESRLARNVAPQMEAGDYTGGLEQLARSLVQTRQHQTAATTNTWIIILAVIAGIVILWLVLRSSKRSSAMSSLREPLERQRSDVIGQLNFLDENLSVLEGAAAAAVREARASAGSRLDEASRLMARAKDERDLSRAQALLDQAQSDIARGRAVISGDAPPPGAAQTYAPTGSSAPAPGQSQDWTQVPQNERGVCFFCSRPMYLRDLTPVTVNLEGQQQRVLACPDDLATIRTGQTPQIRAFNDNGRYVPWYAYQGYDPYRDYYTRGYGTGSFLQDMVALSFIDNMFWNWHHPMGWGWGGGYGGWGGNTYIFYPEHEVYRDYYGGQAAGYGDFSRSSDAGGADFLQGASGDYSSAAGGADLAGSDRS